ncbi:MAG: tRNA 2-thiouridine(34) synthase MnmA [Candidatus Babeliaceae bacterium]
MSIILKYYKKTMNIAVLVSGGVDSSVALRLLKEQGHQVTAFYLKIWLEDELSFLGACPWEEDLHYVRAVCEQLNVPLEIIPFQKAYWDTVVAYTIQAVKSGQTPNPDMLCNQQVKFGAFYDHIGAEFDKVATGHYAQIFEENGHFYLKRSPDTVKDQTYFLALLNQQQLARALFPIGHLNKMAVRALAKQYNLATSHRKDSQGICFLGKLKFNDFIKQYCGEQMGDIIEHETGQKKGVHKGFWYHTIGQRQGIRLSGGPWYVVAKDIYKNIIYISRQYYAADKTRNTFIIATPAWLPENLNNKLTVKLRHGAEDYACLFKQESADKWHVTIDGNDQGIAAGQFAVFYDNQKCLGGSTINESK